MTKSNKIMKNVETSEDQFKENSMGIQVTQINKSTVR